MAATPTIISDPDCHRGPDHTLKKLTAYIAQSLRARTWLIVRDDEKSFIFIHRMHSRHVNLAGFRFHFLMGLTEISCGQTVRGFDYMHTATGYLHNLVMQRCPLMVQEVLLAASRAISGQVPELADLMLQFLIQAAQQSHDRQFNDMFVNIQDLDSESFRDFAYRACLVCMDCLNDHADAKISPREGHASPTKLLTHLCSAVNPNLAPFPLGEFVRVKFRVKSDG
jgi:hypothetical protein